MAAGSLKDAFTAVFADYTKQYGGGFSPVWGPSGVLRERLQKGEAFDVFASATLPHAQALTDAGVSGPSVMFARNALCIVTEAGSPLDTGNLVDTLLRPDVGIGTSTPVADPAGDYTWEMFRKVDAMRPGAFDTLSKKAQQLVGGPADTRRGEWTLAPPGRARRSQDWSVRHLLLRRATDGPGLREIQIGRVVAGTVGRPGIWIDGLAQGDSRRRRFRDVSVVAAGTGNAEIVRLYSSCAAG